MGDYQRTLDFGIGSLSCKLFYFFFFGERAETLVVQQKNRVLENTELTLCLFVCTCMCVCGCACVYIPE